MFGISFAQLSDAIDVEKRDEFTTIEMKSHCWRVSSKFWITIGN